MVSSRTKNDTVSPTIQTALKYSSKINLSGFMYIQVSTMSTTARIFEKTQVLSVRQTDLPK